MRKTIFATLIFVFLLTDAAFCRLNVSVVIVPPLPMTVALDDRGQYYQDGYYYHHRGRAWVYSESDHGPWMRLPRNHYPKNFHYKNHDHGNRWHDRGNRHYDKRR